MPSSPITSSDKSSQEQTDYQRLSSRLLTLGLNRSALALWLGVSQQAVSKWAMRGVSAVSRPAIAAAIARPLDWIAGGAGWSTDLPLDFARDRVLWRNAEHESFSVQVVPATTASGGSPHEWQYLKVSSAIHEAVRKGQAHSFADELTLVEYLQRAVFSAGVEVDRRAVSRALQAAERFKPTRFEPDLIVSSSGTLICAIAVRAATRWVNANGIAPAYSAPSDDAFAATTEPVKETRVSLVSFPRFAVCEGDTLTLAPVDLEVPRGLYFLRLPSGEEQMADVRPALQKPNYEVFLPGEDRGSFVTLDWLQDNLVRRVVRRCGPVSC